MQCAFLPQQAVEMKRAKLSDVQGGRKQWGRIVVSGCHEGGKSGGSEGGGSHGGVGVVEWWVRGCLGGERCGLVAWVAKEGWCRWRIGAEGAQEFIACCLRGMSVT